MEDDAIRGSPSTALIRLRHALALRPVEISTIAKPLEEQLIIATFLAHTWGQQSDKPTAGARMDRAAAASAVAATPATLERSAANGHSEASAADSPTMQAPAIFPLVKPPAAASPPPASSNSHGGVDAPAKADDFTLGEVLGIGTFGTVFRAVDSRTGVEVAVKAMRLDRDAHAFRRELQVRRRRLPPSHADPELRER